MKTALIAIFNYLTRRRTCRESGGEAFAWRTYPKGWWVSFWAPTSCSMWFKPGAEWVNATHDQFENQLLEGAINKYSTPHTQAPSTEPQWHSHWNDRPTATSFWWVVCSSRPTSLARSNDTSHIFTHCWHKNQSKTILTSSQSYTPCAAVQALSESLCVRGGLWVCYTDEE